jgi:cell division septation protein DedD
MANAIVKFARPAFLPAVAPEAAKTVANEFAGGLGGGAMPLPVLSIRGKEWRMRWNGEEINLKARAGLEVVLVAARSSTSKRYYEDSYVSGEVLSPTCASVDGIAPNVSTPVSKACATCPKNVWGSGVRQDGTPSKGKACSDFKRLVVWPVGLNREGRSVRPAVLDLPATSFKTREPGTMALKEYVMALGTNGIPVYGYVAKLDFADAEFPQVTFEPVRPVTEEEYEAVLEMREDDDVQEVLFGGSQEATGTITPVKELPAAVKEPAAEEETEEDAPPPPPKKPAAKKAAKAAPAPEPEPEPEAQDEGGETDDDLLAEIEGLLNSK